MGIGDGTETVVDTPVREELLGCGSSELRAPVRHYVIRNAKGEVLRSAVMSSAAPSMDFSAMGQPEYRSTITICVSLVVEKIGT